MRKLIKQKAPANLRIDVEPIPSTAKVYPPTVELIPLSKKPEAVERLHKQPRSYLKTISKTVGKTMDEPTLFSLPETYTPGSGDNLIRQAISRNTAILGNYLLELYQQSGKDELVIDNLSILSNYIGQTNHEIKLYLTYLGGYAYPIVDKDPDGGITLSTELLFNIKFKYNSETAQKYNQGEYRDLEIGTRYVRFIKNEPVERITIKPNERFIKALKGDGLGNVLVVSDKFIRIALSLTDIAYKILCYTASNRPHQKITEDKLIDKLGLEKQLRAQGRPRIRATLLKGFEELKERGHIIDYSFYENTSMYIFTYSDTYVRHSDNKKAH